jgi:hypothetical protein
MDMLKRSLLIKHTIVLKEEKEVRIPTTHTHTATPTKKNYNHAPKQLGTDLDQGD